MSMQVDFYFDYGSPTSYLAYEQMPGLAERTGAVVRFRPILLGGILQATSNVSPMDIPLKRKWMIADMEFFARRYGVPFTVNPNFPINTLNLMRGAIYAQREGFLLEYSDAVFTAMWADGRNLGDIAEIKAVLTAAHLPVDAILAATQDPEIKDALKRETQAAVQRGLFGAPVLFVGNTMFFGQDRVQYAEEEVRRQEQVAV
ncbi:disulfide bond formation protein DsbA [Paraburkholderia phytofirmans OLGA172]|uniref:2-hydroxychromene-2-carboxylate isomerase n=2 Tax=Paraburkholderia phytofirmans TaxID=261302 RepID=A0A160FRG6_9BURK|nr:2-hydroxychromene-2-carboxylate isomerase [Paraburkholderia phytofirmans]ANB75595.1 disulfide bond formation protein DsbA [Paraburkholderia phytofirmans OLGA172]